MVWSRDNTAWTLTLFGTAVGAGILFLPINLGINGLYSVIFLGIFAFPMTYFSHKALCHFVLSSSLRGGNITDVAEEYFGKHFGQLLTWLYFLSIYPILLIYAIGATNTIESYIVHQLGFETPARWLLSLIVVLSMIGVILMDQDKVIKVTSLIVYPLIAVLFLVSVYFIPHWNLASTIHTTSLDLGSFVKMLWTCIPVMIFSFNHSPIISSFAKDQHEKFGEDAYKNADNILRATSAILLLFVMFFVISCILSLTPEMLNNAKEQNLSVMSYMANQFNTPTLNVIGPLIAITAIVSSFFGHYLGAAEGFKSIMKQESPAFGVSFSDKQIHKITLVFFTITLWLCAYLNPSILSLIQMVSGPITAIILFIMPAYAFLRVEKLKPLMCRYSHTFLLTLGLIAVSSLLWEIMV
ncbi:MAG: hypothetical protein OXE99_13450 [Cellvibrionales bacterium]|nr:hypothetical protein [Cellvibrionales bacterium]